MNEDVIKIINLPLLEIKAWLRYNHLEIHAEEQDSGDYYTRIMHEGSSGDIKENGRLVSVSSRCNKPIDAIDSLVNRIKGRTLVFHPSDYRLEVDVPAKIYFNGMPRG